jgi:ribosomal small subunit protein bTHX
MGRGDKKSAKGKRTIGSYGVSRQKKKSTYKPSEAATTTSEDKVKKVAVKKEVEAKKPAAAKKPVAAKKVKEETSTEE